MHRKQSKHSVFISLECLRYDVTVSLTLWGALVLKRNVHTSYKGGILKLKIE